MRSQRGVRRCIRRPTTASTSVERLQSQRAGVAEKLAALEIERGNKRNDALRMDDEIRAKRSLHNAIETELQEIRLDHQRHELELSSLVERLQEEYGIDLCAAAETFDAGEEVDWDETRATIEDLRRKMDRLGAVNMEALDELTELESRAESLQGQKADVERAAADLEDLIRRIEKGQRRAFSRDLRARPHPLSAVLPQAFRRGQGRRHPRGRKQDARLRDRDHRQATRKGAPVRVASVGRGKGADDDCATLCDPSQEAQSVRDSGRGGRTPGREQHRALRQRW